MVAATVLIFVLDLLHHQSLREPGAEADGRRTPHPGAAVRKRHGLFRRTRWRCEDISFEAYEGESRIILGAAGSGKTVLLKTAHGA